MIYVIFACALVAAGSLYMLSKKYCFCPFACAMSFLSSKNYESSPPSPAPIDDPTAVEKIESEDIPDFDEVTAPVIEDESPSPDVHTVYEASDDENATNDLKTAKNGKDETRDS